MKERRWPWVLSAALMLAAAVVAGWSTYLYWLPCRGSMLSGSIARLYAYGSGFSEGCLRRMDAGTPFPYPPLPADQTAWASELAVVAIALAGLSWLPLVLGLRWPWRTRAVALLPTLATSAVAYEAARAIDDLGRSEGDYLSGWLWLTIEGAAVLALVAIAVWQPDVTLRGFLRLLVALWGSTAFGAVHGAFDYGLMMGFSDANWDVPPGTGYLTVAALVLAALLTVILMRGARQGQVSAAGSSAAPAASR